MVISVIVPVYNTEVYLRDCLDSVFKQTADNFEVICVDDGSVDNSLAVLEEYRALHDNMRVLHQANSGPAIARNKGIECAKGEYLIFLDSDDFISDRTIEILGNAIEKSRAEVIFYNICEVFDSNGRNNAIYEYYRPKQVYDGFYSGRELFTEKVEAGDQVDSACLLCVNKKWLLDNGIMFYPNALYEDALFSLECYFKSKKVVHVNDGLYSYRVRANSIMTSKADFENIKWRLHQFEFCLANLIQQDLSDREKGALAKYTKKTISDIKSMYFSLSDEERNKFSELNTDGSLLAYALGLNENIMYNNIFTFKGFFTAIEGCRQIILYGAGKIGCKVLAYLNKCGLKDKVCGFAVSKREEKRFIDGVPVLALAEYEADADTLVIVCTMENYHRDMYHNARALGFSNIVVIDFAIESEIDKIFL